MLPGLKSRASWVLCLLAIVAVGILSRVFHTGVRVLDKYPGDALYAAMVYVFFRLFWKAPPMTVAATAMVAMILIELFQLTGIAAHMLTSEHLITRICARLMGTDFSFLDLLTYAVGIACICLVDATEPPR